MLRTTSRKAAVAGLAALTLTSSLGVFAAQAATLPSGVTITGLSVAKGSSAATTSTLISGTGFLTLAEPGVKFGANAAANFIVLSDTQIAAVAPKLADDAPAEKVDVTLSDGSTAYDAPVGSTKEDFQYLKPYNATVAAGSLVSSMGGTKLTVTSSEDMGACGSTAFTGNKVTATVGGLAAPVTCVSSTKVALTVPAGTPSKTGPKVVLFHDGVPGAASTAAKYAAVVGTLDKPVGSFAGGESVILTGKGFKNATAWKFGAQAANCTPATGLEDTKVTCVVPAPAGADADPSTAVPGAVSVSFTPADEAPYGVTSKATYTYSDLG